MTERIGPGKACPECGDEYEQHLPGCKTGQRGKMIGEPVTEAEAVMGIFLPYLRSRYNDMNLSWFNAVSKMTDELRKHDGESNG